MIPAKKLFLASAIAALSTTGFAMEAMDDDSMSAATGQDGLTITMDTNLSGLGIHWIDRDGVTGDATYNKAGAVVISPVGISTTGVTILIDAGGNTGSGATGTAGMLQVKVSTPNATTINLNNTQIGVSDAPAAGDITTSTPVAGIITFSPTASLTIAGGATTTIQLGNSSQGSMVKIAAVLPSVSLTGLVIQDPNTFAPATNGSIGIGTITLGTVNLAATVDAVGTGGPTPAGLKINTAGTTIASLGLQRIRFGDTTDLKSAAPTTPSIGDVYINNLSAATTITVSGH